MTLDPIKLARDLIDIPSITEDEAELAKYLFELLERLGLDCRRYPVEGERFNLVATASSTPSVLFCTHLDTVPPFFGSSADEEVVRGRGACDAKGILASMIVAGEQLLQQGERRFGYLLVVGEETDSIGAKRANEDIELASDFIVVGEPTDSRFVSACKGAVTARVGFEGVAAHSAYPERGDSAISRLARAIIAIEDADWGESAELGRATANVGVVRGGRKPNVVPDEAELELMIRTVDSHEVVTRRIRSVVEPYRGEIVESYGGNPLFFHVPEGEQGVVVAFGT
ncbi:MAG: M20/M25/M40 family metallo-hydrolase, partial [Acidobacteria bacterium]|nr:M20/M25/M40 family metallo-hydrolase [Acidobacteriota bacterium]